MCMFSHLPHQHGVTVLANHDTIIQDQRCKSALSSSTQRAHCLLARLGFLFYKCSQIFFIPLT